MKIFFFFFMLLSLETTFSQDLEFSLSQDIILRQHDEYQGVIHADTSGYMTHIYERSGKGLLHHPGRRLILEKYNKELQLEYSYEYGTDGMISLELISMGTQLIWIVMEKTKAYNYAYSMIQIGTDGKEGKKQLLFTTRITSSKDIPITDICLSPDSSVVAFTAVFDDDSKKKETEVYAAVIDNQTTIKWDKFTKLKGNQKQYEISDFHVSNSGAVVMLSKYFRNTKGKNTVKTRNNEKKAGYTMNILKLTAENKTPHKIELGLKGAFIHQAVLEINPSTNHLYCAGMTSANEGGNINGVFISEFDQQLNKLSTTQRKFSNQELISLHRKDIDVKFKSDKEGLDDDYELCNILLSDDGTVTLIAEENFIRTVSNNMGGIGYYSGLNSGNNVSIEFNSNAILLAQMSNEGDIANLNVIPKKQTTILSQGRNFINPSVKRMRQSDLFMSHSIMNYKDEFFVFYNEHRDNFRQRNKTKRVDRINRMVAAVVHSNAALETQLNPLFSKNEDAFLISPTRSRQLNENTFFITLVEPTRNNSKKIRIGTVSFN